CFFETGTVLFLGGSYSLPLRRKALAKGRPILLIKSPHVCCHSLYYQIVFDELDQLLRHHVDVRNVEEVIPELGFDLCAVRTDTGSNNNDVVFAQYTNHPVDAPFLIVDDIVVSAAAIRDNDEQADIRRQLQHLLGHKSHSGRSRRTAAGSHTGNAVSVAAVNLLRFCIGDDSCILTTGRVSVNQMRDIQFTAKVLNNEACNSSSLNQRPVGGTA